MKTKICLSVNSLALVVVLLGGCGIDWGPSSPYTQHYENKFEAVRLPDSDEIEQAGVGWTFQRPSEEVWEACVRVVSQYEGIIKADAGSLESRRMLFVHGRGMQVEPKGFADNDGTVFTKFMDTWIAIDVRSKGTDSTSVAAAWISPETGRAERLVDISTSGASQRSLLQSAQPASYDSLVTYLAEERQSIAQEIAANRKYMECTERWSLMPRVIINQLFQDLSTQLLGPDRWEKKLVIESPVQSAISLSGRTAKPEKKYRYADLERKVGNWTSAMLRRSNIVINCPVITTKLETVVARLKKAAGEPSQQVKIYIIASPEVNAFSVPNGDIFVCSGLLEALDNVDEVAAVLAHEYDHMFCHDSIGKLKERKGAKTTSLMIVAAGSAAAQGAAMAMAPAAGAAASTSTRLTAEAVGRGIVLTAQLASAAAYSAIVEGYSQKVELRADANGAKYMYAAGFEPSAEISLLEKLKIVQEEAKRKDQKIASSLVNCKPGITERMERMKKTLQELGIQNNGPKAQ